MNELTYDVSPNDVLVLKVKAGLELRGHDEAAVRVTGKGAADAVWSERQANEFCLQAKKNVTVDVPRAVTLRLEFVGEHLHLDNVPQGAQADHVGGHARLHNAGPVRLDHVGGHATLRQIQGDVRCRHVGGHLKLEACQGNLRADSVGGHAKARDVSGAVVLLAVGGHAELTGAGDAQIVKAGGHIRANLRPRPDFAYEFEAGGNLHCQVPRNAHATFHIASGAGLNETRIMGDGHAQIRLHAGGLVKVVDETEDAPAFSRQVRAGVGSALSQARDKFNRVLDEGGLTAQQRTDLQAQFSDIAEEAVETVKEVAETVNEKAKTVWEQDVKPSLQSRLKRADAEAGQTAAAPREDAPSKAEERKMVLRMLAEGKITVEEANDLLQTLTR